MILRRSAGWPGDRYSTVDRNWEGETCCVIGGGESLTQADVDLTRGRCKVIAINDAYQLAPWAAVCYFADARWWTWHKENRKFMDFMGQKCTIERSGWSAGQPANTVEVPDVGVHVLRNYGAKGLSVLPDGLCTGQNGGAQGINLAALAGATCILLLGFDMRPGHWHSGHPVPTPDSEWSIYLSYFEHTRNKLVHAGVQVVNCSPGSALDCFPKMGMSEALCELTR